MQNEKKEEIATRGTTRAKRDLPKAQNRYEICLQEDREGRGDNQ